MRAASGLLFLALSLVTAKIARISGDNAQIVGGWSVPINLMPDVMLAHRKMTSRNLAEPIRIAKQRLALVKSANVMRVGFEIRAANCEAPDCRPDELPEYLPECGA